MLRQEHLLSLEYEAYVGRKKLFLLGLGGLCLLLGLLSVAWGAVRIPVSEVIEVLLGGGEGRAKVIVVNIRLPQTLAAMLAGGGLSLAGLVMQAVLRNPLGSPFTLGISNAAAFGAAFSIIVLGSGTMQSTAADAVTIMDHWLTTGAAFAAALACMGIVLFIVSATGGAGEVMVLAGVALSSLFTAGTMFLQYFADDAQLAATVFWTFGDVSRASWREIPMMSALLALSSALFFYRRFDLNALCCGDETAVSLGVSASWIRLEAMVVTSLLAAVMVAFLGVIGFVGLVCPHMLRRFLGGDHRFLIPGSVLLGAALLTGADMGARLLLAPRLLPVSIFTAFMGAPVFVALLMKRRSRK
ncbi:MAG: iron ABC transporter permease [Pyramidobacter sp.]|uniref:FecCD family ABC transporter permease n=2 Tax=Pyramidobacter sp. TaxID=1943581 RepID=UPI0025F6C003|nr:iron ABC transporter permease [Pyramidobacter sp.]MCI7403027.1 iron ABC transporter permease [Pyramidobacter sp.]